MASSALHPSTTDTHSLGSEDVSKKSKKKRKHRERDHEQSGPAISEIDKPRKKKKSEKVDNVENGDKQNMGNDTDASPLAADTIEGRNETHKKQKKHRKSVDANTTNSSEASTHALKKSKKTKHVSDSSIANNTASASDATLAEYVADKPKKKKRSHSEHASTDVNSPVAIDPALTLDVEKPKKKKKKSQPEPSSTSATVNVGNPPTMLPLDSLVLPSDSADANFSEFDPAATQLMASALLSALVAASNGEQPPAGPSAQPLYPLPFPAPSYLPPGVILPMPPPDQDSNEMVLKALQDLDLSKLTSVLKSLEDAASAANVSLPQSVRHAPVLPPIPTPVGQVPPSSRSILASGSHRPSAASDGYTSNDHAYLLANKWMSTQQLADLVKTQGLVYKKGKFSALEEQQLEAAIENYRVTKGLSESQLVDVIFPKEEKNKENAFWFEITAAVPQRPIVAVYHHIRRSHHPLRRQGKWTSAEDDKLRRAVMAHGQHWQTVSLHVGRGGMDCRDRYRNHIVNKETRIRGLWSEEEEVKLTRIVTSMTVDKGRDADNDVFWTAVAQKMGGTRTRAQCRIKWTDSLNSSRKNNGEKPRWGNRDSYILVHKLDALQVQHDSEIDWKTIPDDDWNLWSAHVLQVRWQAMKKSIKGHEYMSYREILDILKVKKIDAEPSDPIKKRSSKVTSATAVVESGTKEETCACTPTDFHEAGTYTCVTSAHEELNTLELTIRNEILDKCRTLRQPPALTSHFERDTSDRFENGTRPTLIRNATIFTGELNATGPVLVFGDILLDRGLVKEVGHVDLDVMALQRKNLTIINAQRAWITPGLIDVNSQLGISSIPFLNGANDANSRRGPVLPWLRAIDALNTHDEGFRLAIASGVTTAQIIPGNENSIGGQPAVIKLRKTSERSPTSMLVYPRGDDWGRLQHGCGEDLSHYAMTRMDSVWALRSAYHDAQDIKTRQDAFCDKAEAGLWKRMSSDFPSDARVDMLVDVLRKKAKLSVHCNAAVDIDAFVQLSNEFKFPVSTFHQASEAWLIPRLINKTWGEPPRVALSSDYRTKLETFRASEFAAGILKEANISVVIQSGYPNINARTLVQEAQQAFYYGFPEDLALSSITSNGALSLGVSDRVGLLREGRDADVVLWDSHPLSIGATPRMVWIDGILQFGAASNDSVILKANGSHVTAPPNWDKEKKEALQFEGLPPLNDKSQHGKFVFHNVSRVWARRDDGAIDAVFKAKDNTSYGVVILDGGRIVCADTYCRELEESEAQAMDLSGGSISPGFLAYGSPMGLSEILSEPSTGRGDSIYDAFISDVPKVYHDVGGVLRAADSLVFQTRNALVAYHSGITSAVSFSSNSGVIGGLSTAFRPGALHAMQYGAIIQNIVALHIKIAKPLRSQDVSVNSQISGLRSLLYGWEGTESETGKWFKRASEGVVPLVVNVDSADIMASLIILKADVEDKIGSRMRMVFSGAAEAHLLANDIANAGVGVILRPRATPLMWDARRALPGPPLSNDTTLTVLLSYGVRVGIASTNARFELAEIVANGDMKEKDAYALASTNLEELLGIRLRNKDLVVYKGGHAFELSSKPVAIISPERGLVDVL